MLVHAELLGPEPEREPDELRQVQDGQAELAAQRAHDLLGRPVRGGVQVGGQEGDPAVTHFWMAAPNEFQVNNAAQVAIARRLALLNEL